MSATDVPKPDLGPNDSLAWIQLVVVGILCGLSLLVLILRIPLRIWVLKSIGPDDYLIAVSMLTGIGVLICFKGETDNGMGRHAPYLSLDNQEKIAQWQFYHSIIVMLGISFVKLSIGAVLLRFVSSKTYKNIVWGTTIFLVLFTISCLFTLIFSCVPPEATWNFALRPEATCFSGKTFTGIGLFNSAVNSFTDLAFVALPIPVILKLQVNKKTKITLIAILGLGTFACVASLIKISYQVNALAEPDRTRYNLFNLWNAVELYTGIIAACLPTLRPLFKKLLETTRSWSSWTRPSKAGRSGYGNVSGATGERHRASMLKQSRGSRGLVRIGDDDAQELTQFDFGEQGGKTEANAQRSKELEARVRIQAFQRGDDGSEESFTGLPEGAIMKTTDFSIH